MYMRKVCRLLIFSFIALGLINCASKGKKSSKKGDGISILQPDQGDGSGLGVNPEGGVLDATNIGDKALNLNATGSDTGKISGLYTVNFEYDRARLTEESRSLLASNVDWIKGNPGKIVQLEGHCDERGSTEYNLALGDRRARSVKDYLVSLGIDPNQLVVISYGKEKPLSYGDSNKDHGLNRRVNFLPIDQ